jgi:hypothetical protein
MPINFMEKGTKLSKVLLYQNVGFLAVIALGFLDEVVRLSSLVFGAAGESWEFRKATVGMLLVLAVWFLVGRFTQRALARLQYLEKFLRVCSWCRQIDYKGQWVPLEQFMKEGFDTPTTHGICPHCLAEQKAAIARAKEAKPEAKAQETPA